MKKVTLILLILSIVFLLVGCSGYSELDKAPSKEQEQKRSTLMILDEYYTGVLLVDRDTRVMYWMSDGKYNRGTLTLLVDQDGNPKIWDGQ